MFGIEIEVEGVERPPSFDNYSAVPDGSLRNYGVEYVSNILSFKQAKDSYSSIITTLKKVGADFHQRCGVHIHIDFREKGKEDIVKFLHRYVTIERELIRICGESRSSNNFCLPLLEADGDREVIRNYLHGSGDRESLYRNLGKYSALNLRPLAIQGSIEFRMLPSDGDVKRFNTVINMLNTITYQDKSIEDICTEYNIPTSDYLEGIAFMESLKQKGTGKSGMKYIEKHFGYKEEVAGITEDLVRKYMEAL